jgi:hypothetical protein
MYVRDKHSLMLMTQQLRLFISSFPAPTGVLHESYQEFAVPGGANAAVS